MEEERTPLEEEISSVPAETADEAQAVPEVPAEAVVDEAI